MQQKLYPPCNYYFHLLFDVIPAQIQSLDQVSTHILHFAWKSAKIIPFCQACKALKIFSSRQVFQSPTTV